MTQLTDPRARDISLGLGDPQEVDGFCRAGLGVTPDFSRNNPHPTLRTGQCPSERAP